MDGALPTDDQIETAYRAGSERYESYGVDTEAALAVLAETALSLQCWQGDDVRGFEDLDATDGGGIQATGNYPGRARNADELRRDADLAFALIPGPLRFNLHASYAETGGATVPRNALEARHFARWIDWARARGVGLDFNPTCFAHPLADSGFTLAHADAGIREFWIEHCQACRKIGAAMGAALASPCVTNLWIPDGYKDYPADRLAPRARLLEALDTVFRETLDPNHNLDAVEGKLFGIGSESYVAGSHEFYLGYAITRGKLLCIDSGHFHPTESVADKLSSVMLYLDRALLHISRGVRWDSDHVVVLGDDVRAIMEELVRHGYLGRVHLGLDFFDASINRIAAWVIGARATRQALLLALLQPHDTLRTIEEAGDFTRRLALLETMKTLPFGAIWDEHCRRHGVPAGMGWMDAVDRYASEVLALRQ